MEKYYVAFDMSPNHKHQKDYHQVIIAQKNETWTPNDYVPPPVVDDDDQEKDDDTPTDDKDDQEKDEDGDEGIDTSDMGEGENKLPLPSDDSTRDKMEQNMLIIVIGCSLGIFILITILTCCCCKKRAYRNKSETFRNYTVVSEEFEVLDR